MTKVREKPKKFQKVVKVPVRIADEDEALRRIKYRALDKVMAEARFLGNMAIRYAIAFGLEKIREQFKKEEGENPPALATRIYRLLVKERKCLEAGTVASLSRNFALKLYSNTNRDAWAGKKSLPTYRSLFVPFRKQGTKVEELEIKGTTQFIIEPAGFGHVWLPDELIDESIKHLVEASKRKAAQQQKAPEKQVSPQKNPARKKRPSKKAPTSTVKIFEPPKGEITEGMRKLTLVSRFSWKDSGSIAILRRIMSGEYQLSDSQIQKGKKGLMLYLSYSFQPEQPQLDPERVCGVDLGVVIPAVCAVNFGPERLPIGYGSDVMAARSKFRAVRRRKQQRMGLYSKTRKWEMSEKEVNWINTYYHALTRQVIKFALQNGCGTIHIEDLSTLRQKQMKNEYQRLLWVPSKFGQLLDYKAKELGIRIVKVNPRNTSRRCSQIGCGHISENNRISQSKFVCEKCGDPDKPIDADYNAARNIALADEEAIIYGYGPREENEDNEDELFELES